MFQINRDKSIHLTRGDIATIDVSANMPDGAEHSFKIGDIVRFKVFEKGRMDNIVLEKDVEVDVETPTVTFSLGKNDTRIGEHINKPKEYWYEVEINPDTKPQTIIGYDSDGPKVFKLFPEGDD